MLLRSYYSISIWEPLKVCTPRINCKYMLATQHFKCTGSMQVYCTFFRRTKNLPCVNLSHMSGPLRHVTQVPWGSPDCLRAWRSPRLLAARSYWICNHVHVSLHREPWKCALPSARKRCHNTNNSRHQLLTENKHLCSSKEGRHQKGSRGGHMVLLHLSSMSGCMRNDLIITAVHISCK